MCSTSPTASTDFTAYFSTSRFSVIIAQFPIVQIAKEYGGDAAPELVRYVEFSKGPGQPFGFKITSQHGVKGVSVSAIVPGGAADASGKLFVGDFLLKVCLSIVFSSSSLSLHATQINDDAVLHSNHDFCVDCTRLSSSTMKLAVTREITPEVGLICFSLLSSLILSYFSSDSCSARVSEAQRSSSHVRRRWIWYHCSK